MIGIRRVQDNLFNDRRHSDNDKSSLRDMITKGLRNRIQLFQSGSGSNNSSKAESLAGCAKEFQLEDPNEIFGHHGSQHHTRSISDPAKLQDQQAILLETLMAAKKKKKPAKESDEPETVGIDDIIGTIQLTEKDEQAKPEQEKDTTAHEAVASPAAQAEPRTCRKSQLLPQPEVTVSVDEISAAEGESVVDGASEATTKAESEFGSMLAPSNYYKDPPKRSQSQRENKIPNPRMRKFSVPTRLEEHPTSRYRKASSPLPGETYRDVLERHAMDQHERRRRMSYFGHDGFDNNSNNNNNQQRRLSAITASQTGVSSVDNRYRRSASLSAYYVDNTAAEREQKHRNDFYLNLPLLL